MWPAYGDAGRSTSIATLGGLTQLTWTAAQARAQSTSPVSVAATDRPCSRATRRMNSWSGVWIFAGSEQERSLGELLAAQSGRLVEDVDAIIVAEQVAQSDHRRVVLGVNQVTDPRRAGPVTLPAALGILTGSLAILDGPSTASEVIAEGQGQRPGGEVVDLVVQAADLAVELPLAERLAHVELGRRAAIGRAGRPAGRR